MTKAAPRFDAAVPPAAERCGPCVMPDDSALRLTIQHRGEHQGRTFENTPTR